MRLLLVSLIASLVVGCSRDLSLPGESPKGGLSGTLVLPDAGPLGSVDLVLEPIDGPSVATTSDADGGFSFDSLEPGQWVLRASPADFVELARPVGVVSGVKKDLGLIVMRPLALPSDDDATLEGTVRIERDADPTGAELTFTNTTTGQLVARLSVGASGTYSQRLPPGIWAVQASHPLYVSSAVLTVTLEAKQRLAMQDLLLTINPATIEGRVLKEVDLSNDPTAAVGAVVTTSSGGSAVTDMDGRFRIMGLPAGTETITITLAGFHDVNTARTVRLAPMQTATLADVTLLLDRGDLTGEVEMADNTPLRDVTASLDLAMPSADGGTSLNPYSATVSPSTSAPARGAYLIRNVPIGTWSVRVSRQQYVTATSTGVLVEAGRTRNVGLLRLVRVQGDFEIDDGDVTNTPGFTRVTGVTLRLSGVASAIEYRVAQDNPTLAGVAFTPFGGAITPSNIPLTLTSGDGSKLISLQYRDAMNNVSPVLSASVVLDTLAPNPGTLVLGDGSGFTRSSAAVPVVVNSFDPRATGADVSSGVAYVRLAGALPADGGMTLDDGRRAYQATQSFTRPNTADGVQLIYAQFIDNAGNETAPITASIVVDTIAPSGSFAIVDGARATSPGFTNSQLVDLTMSAASEPNGGFVQVRLVNESATDLPFAPLQPVRSRLSWILEPTAGQRTVRAMLVDAAGNTAVLTERTITLDQLAPSVTATLVTPSVTNALGVTLSLTATDSNPLSPTQALTLSEDPTFTSAGTTTPAPFPATNLGNFTLPAGDGVRRVYARVRDAAGNDTVANVSLTLDQTAPTGSLTLTGTLADGTTSSTATASGTVVGTLTHAGATLMQLGNESLTTCSTLASDYVAVASSLSPLTLTGSATPRQVRVCLRDAAGNRTGPLTATLDLDTAAPSGCTIAVTGRKVDGNPAPAGRTALRDVTVAFSGCSETPTEVFITNGALTCTATAALDWQPWSSSMLFTLTGGDGASTVRACVRDAARNAGATGTASMSLDTTPPSLAPTISIDTGAAWVNASQVSTRGGNIASVSGVAAGATEWALSETSPPTGFVTFSSPTNFTFGGTGLRTLYALFRDDVGNTTVVAQDSIEFDVTPPTGAGGTGSASVSITGSLASGTPSQSLTATTSISVELLVAGASEYVLGNESMTACPSSGWLTLTSTLLGSQTLTGSASPRQVRACYRDAAGNTVGPFTDTIVLDTTAPSSCALTVNGFKRDATAAPTNRAALQDVTVTVAGCSETPVDLYLTETTPTCVATVSLPWGPFSTPAPFFLSSGDGTHTVRGCVRDAAGNVTSVVADDLVLDTQGPTLATLSINAGASWVNASQVVSGNTTLSLTGSATGATDWGVSTTGTPTTFVPIATATQNLSVSATPDGTRSVYGLFRDDVQNASILVTDEIDVDATPPSVSGVSLDIRSTGSTGFTNSEVVTVAVTGDPDATRAYLAERTASGACTTTDVNSATPQAKVSSYTFALSPAEGLKRLCLQYRDEAGNTSGLLESTIVLDKTSPTVPQIVNSDQYVRLPNAAPFFVDTSSPSIDTNLNRYEQLGGLGSDGGTQLTWRPAIPANDAGTRFTFFLMNDGGETGVRNELRLRAVDLAGNASGESVVFVTADTNAPNTIDWKPEWVDNGNARGTIFWVNDGGSSDLAGYRVYYGSTANFADSEAAAFAAEGVSPIPFPSAQATSFTLSSLPNGVATYARVRAVDLAGNVGEWQPDGGTEPIKVQPGEVSINELSLLSVPGPQFNVQRMARAGNKLYVVAASCDVSNNATLALYTVDLKQMPSPVQNGFVQTSIDSPSVVNSLVFADLGSCTSVQIADAVVDGPFLYVLSTSRLYTLSLRNPKAPSLISSVDLTALGGAVSRTRGVQLYGDKVAVWGQGGTSSYFASVLSLASLYDNSSGTRPSTAGALTFTAAGNTAMSGWAVRDRLFGGSTASQGTQLTAVCSVAPALAAVPSAPVAQASVGMPLLATRPPVSGALMLIASGRFGMTVYDATPALTDGGVPTVSSATAYSGYGQMELLGHQLLMPDDSESNTRVLDLQDLSNPTNVGTFASPAAARNVLGFGNNAVFHGGDGVDSKLWFYELATPRALRSVGAFPGMNFFSEVRDGFLHTGGGVSVDLLSTSQLPLLNAQHCATGMTISNDVEVTAVGTGLEVRKLDAVTDRNPTTSALGTYTVGPLSGGGRVGDVAFHGSWLVLAVIRAASVDIDVCDARKALNRGTTNMTTADCSTVASVAIATANTWTARLALSAGRAVVGLDRTSTSSSASGVAGANVYVVELQNLFDDDATTSGTTTAGPFTTAQVRDIAIQGDFAYLSTGTGLVVMDVRNAMDTDPSTVLAANPIVKTVAANSNLGGLYVSGSLALTTPASPGGSGAVGVIAFDISTPAQTNASGFYPMAPDTLASACLVSGDTFRFMPPQVSVAGTRAYVTIGGTLQILELE